MQRLLWKVAWWSLVLFAPPVLLYVTSWIAFGANLPLWVRIPSVLVSGYWTCVSWSASVKLISWTDKKGVNDG